MERSLARRTSWAATSRTCPTPPGAPASSGSATVWTESTTTTSGRTCSTRDRTAPRSVSAASSSPGVQGPQPLGLEADLLARLLGADVQHLALGGEAGEHPQQGRLADAGLAGQQHHRPGDQTAAEDAVGFVDAGGPVGAGLGGDVGDGTGAATGPDAPAGGGPFQHLLDQGCSRRRSSGSGRPSAGLAALHSVQA